MSPNGFCQQLFSNQSVFCSILLVWVGWCLFRFCCVMRLISIFSTKKNPLTLTCRPGFTNLYSNFIEPPCVLIKEITSMIGQTYWPPVSSAKHFFFVPPPLTFQSEWYLAFITPIIHIRVIFIALLSSSALSSHLLYCVCPPPLLSPVIHTVRTAVRESSTWTQDVPHGATEFYSLLPLEICCQRWASRPEFFSNFNSSLVAFYYLSLLLFPHTTSQMRG